MDGGGVHFVADCGDVEAGGLACLEGCAEGITG